MREYFFSSQNEIFIEIIKASSELRVAFQASFRKLHRNTPEVMKGTEFETNYRY